MTKDIYHPYLPWSFRVDLKFVKVRERSRDNWSPSSAAVCLSYRCDATRQDGVEVCSDYTSLISMPAQLIEWTHFDDRYVGSYRDSTGGL
jgi:hypothetical protein